MPARIRPVNSALQTPRLGQTAYWLDTYSGTDIAAGGIGIRVAGRIIGNLAVHSNRSEIVTPKAISVRQILRGSSLCRLRCAVGLGDER